MITISQLFDIAAPNCLIRKQAISILKKRGSEKAIEYLEKMGADKDVLKRAKGINTRNWRMLI